MDIRQVDDKLEVKKALEILKQGIDKNGKRVLADISVYMFRQIPVWIGYVDDLPVTINVSYCGRRKRNVWTPHVNEYIAFTRMDVRRRGHATELTTFVKEDARVNNKCVRLKSTIASTVGLRFHQKMGDDIWAMTDENILLVDTPLVDRDNFPPDSTPIEVRKWTNRTYPMTYEEIEQLLQKVKLRDDN